MKSIKVEDALPKMMVKGKKTPKKQKQLGNRIRGQSVQIGAKDEGFPERCCQEEKETHIDLFNQIARSFQVLKESLGLHL